MSALQAAIAQGATVIDVRTPGEYKSGHAPSAVNIPLDEISSHTAELKSHQGPVYFICASGSRSGRAAQLMSRQDVDAVNVKGGTMAWVQAGYPVEQ